jgi:AraC-like DNA-binding protein
MKANNLAAIAGSSGNLLGAAGRSICEFFDCIEDLQFWIKDREGRYVWVNRGFLLNYSLENRRQVMGRTDFDLSPHHLADQFRLDDARVLAGHAIVNRVELVGRFDHTASWSLTNKVPIRNAAGRIVGTAGITQPLKERSVAQLGPDVAMGRVIAYIRGHCGESLANRVLARVAAMSVRAFERHFQQSLHLSPQQYVKRVRLRMACHALVYTRQPLAQIATAHGFSDQSHFSREFRRQMGETPRDYRLHHSLLPR